MYHEALEKQVQLLKVWRSPQGEQWASRITPQIYQLSGAAPTVRDLQFLEIHELENAECFFVTSKICQVIEVAAPTFPDVALIKELLPTPNGWVYLDKGYSVGPPSQIEKSVFGNPPRLKAFSWATESVLKDGKQGEGIGLTFYEDGIPFPYLLSICNWGFGINWGSDWDKSLLAKGTDIEDDVLEKRLRDIGQYVMTLFSFINQKLLVVSPQRPPRGIRRRYEKDHEGIEAPMIRVILLRAKEYLPHGSEHREVEWSCRWIVRGHWRQQWYPSITNHKAIWITPYIKGPQDKPLKRPGHNLFVVMR